MLAVVNLLNARCAMKMGRLLCLTCLQVRVWLHVLRGCLRMDKNNAKLVILIARAVHRLILA